MKNIRLVVTVATIVVFAGTVLEKQVSFAKSAYEEEIDSTIQWNGESYVYNDHLSNFIFIGVDEYELQDVVDNAMNAGQCDALYLVSYDRVTKDMAVISIPRDTMTKVETFLPDGSSAGMRTDHISLSYSFGDGKHKSCNLTRDAVSNLFFGLPIQGYCAMSMGGLSVIPEVIGTFEVVVPNASLEEKYPEYYEGSIITIDSENAELFVRFRDIKTTQSALYRQERQKSFLEAALDQIKVQYQQNPGIVTELYEDLTPYLVTNMGNDLFLDLAEGASLGERVSWNVPGEGVSTEKYDEYHVDDEVLYEKIIETFYKKVE